jgi:hypothetical protein
MDPISIAVAQILEIIPNVEPTHLLQLIETHLPTYSVFHGNHDLRTGGKGKGKRVGDPDNEDSLEGKGKAKDPPKKPKIDIPVLIGHFQVVQTILI